MFIKVVERLEPYLGARDYFHVYEVGFNKN